MHKNDYSNFNKRPRLSEAQWKMSRVGAFLDDFGQLTASPGGCPLGWNDLVLFSSNRLGRLYTMVFDPSESTGAIHFTRKCTEHCPISHFSVFVTPFRKMPPLIRFCEKYPRNHFSTCTGIHAYHEHQLLHQHYRTSLLTPAMIFPTDHIFTEFQHFARSACCSLETPLVILIGKQRSDLPKNALKSKFEL